ncbi:MAG: hypothetical protein COV70_00565 [Parcubacteria group bacterium CG11_big_fil_rev_8_21_14_0_20_39_22]|nr:MAG: hypothetical protein COV70_00565 [Parcubacteria group bacterium CG11_big_fil_rev_8_21_14_0_20_39_22]
MNKKQISIPGFKVFATAVTGFMLFSATAFATVGGPTLVYNLKYNPADQSVYYIERSHSGKGCPPVLEKISLSTGEIESVLSCDDGFSLISVEDNYNSQAVYERIEEITEGFTSLTPIHLKENSIEIDVDFSREEESEEIGYVLRRHFVAGVYQNGVKTDEFPIVGCNRDQPFSFAGYDIPGFNKKIVVLSSTVSDCFEGGYIGEGLHVVDVSGVEDGTSFGNSYKWDEPLIPSAGTRVVFENDEIAVPTGTAGDESTSGDSTAVSEDDSSLPLFTIIVVAAGALGVGVVAGVLIGRMGVRKNKSNISSETPGGDTKGDL